MRFGPIAAILLSASLAHAECPGEPDDPVCRPWSAIALPSLFGAIYSPHHGPTYAGAGIEAVLLAWSDNTEAFGPSQGRIRIDAGLLDASGGAGAVTMIRGGTQLAFERNASRAYGIPFFAVDVGRLWTAAATRWFMDGGVGVYVVHRRSFTVDVEVTGILPFTDPSDYAGVRARLGLSFALW